MIFLYIIGVLLALILLVLMLRVRIIFSYRDKLTLKVGTLFFNYDVLKKRPKKTKKTKKPKDKASTKPKGDGTKKKSLISEFTEDMVIGDFIDMAGSLFSSLGKMVNRHLYVRLKKFRILVGGEDPAKSAIQFGAICQSCAYLFEILRCNTKLYPLEKSEVSVLHDFSADKSIYELEIVVKLRLIHVLGLFFSVLIEFIKLKEFKTNLKGKI